MTSEAEVEYCRNPAHGKHKAPINDKARALSKKYPWAKGLCYICIRNVVLKAVREATRFDFADVPESFPKPPPPKNPDSQVQDDETTLIKVSRVLGITTEAIRDKMLFPDPPRDALLRGSRLSDNSNNITIKKLDVIAFVAMVRRSSPSLERFTLPQQETLKMRVAIMEKMIANGALD